MSSWIGLPAASRSRRPAAELGSAADGFTLVEVLVGFAVAGLLLVVLSRAVGFGVVATTRVQSTDTALLWAQSALDQLGVVAPLRNGDAADLKEGTYKLHVTVERYDDGDAPRLRGYLTLYRLRATVRWHEGMYDRSLMLTTLRLGPPL
jgi:general secretion pathway protein I